MCHPFLHYSHRAVSPSDFNLLRTPIAIIAIIVALKDHLALLACQSGSGREGYNMIITKFTRPFITMIIITKATMTKINLSDAPS